MKKEDDKDVATSPALARRGRCSVHGKARLIVRLLLVAGLFGVVGMQTANAQLTLRPVTWDVVGLDSNRQTVGPDTFQVGARACNTGATTLTNLVGNFVWDSFNANINLVGASVINFPSLAPGRCTDFYYDVNVVRSVASFNTARRYHITVSATGVPAVSTPIPREIYVEQLLSQARNSITSITGPTTVYVGQTYQYTLVASTATQGYEQLEAFLNLSNVVFQVQAIATTYSAPAGATNDKFYADACGWDSDPTHVAPNPIQTYRSCIGPVNYPGGKVGGNLTSVYTVKILSTGTTQATALILDVSGGSYHYNADFGQKVISITALPPPVTLSKLATPTPIMTNGPVTYTLRLTNTGAEPFTLTDFVDTPPASPGAPAYVAGSSTYNGAAIPNPTIAAGKLTWSGSFVVPAGQTRDLTYQMTIPNVPGTYTNSAIGRMDNVQIDTTTDINDNAPATASVVRPAPNVTLFKAVSPTGTVPPGADLFYTIDFTNGGGTPASTFVITDPIPANTDFKVGSAAAVVGTSGLVPTITYSNDGGTSYTYTPTSGAGGAPPGYDRSVTHVRWSFGGNLTTVSPDNTGSVSFSVRIR